MRIPNNPTALFLLILAGLLIFVALLTVAIIFAVPALLIALVAYLWYRHVQLKKLRTAAARVPDTIAERPQHWTPEEFAHNISDRRLLNCAEEETDLYSCHTLADAFEAIAVSLYAAESFHKPPTPPETTDRITIARYNDSLERWQRKVSDEKNVDIFLNTIVTAYLDLREHFPPYALQQDQETVSSSLSTPLELNNESEATERLVSTFFQHELKQRRLFDALRDQIEKNDEGQRTFSIATQFAKTPYRGLLRTQIPITLFNETRFAGM
jgi:hypothetical protein